ncbi:MAG: hypothetical protein H7268_11675 [Sandarakinorhabdus sp.]|nr:hypothetical protein [Sandarakinorhabdus sp.]
MPDDDASSDVPAPDAATQGAAVAKALKGDRSKDIDRWAGFSKAEAAKLASDPPAPVDAVPLAGLAQDGGTVEGS